MSRVLRVHCFQQVPEEGLACILNWIERKGCDLSYTRFYVKDPLPQVDDFDVLIVMGGPMSVYEEELYPWLVDEKRLIKQAVEADKVVLGVCLGSQFIASALGAKVYSGTRKEIGWFPLECTSKGQDFLQVPEGQSVFHWHGDTFDLPEGAELLASSAVTPHQGFVMGDKVVGLQFHLEVNRASLEAMTSSFANELQEDEYIQSAQEIMLQEKNIEVNQQLMDGLLDRLVSDLS